MLNKRPVLNPSQERVLSQEKEKAAKKPYRAPQLVEYGNVAKLTRAMVIGSFVDATGMLMRMPCL